MSKIEIKLSVLRQQVEEGWKKDQLAEHYGISILEMGKHLKNAGLKIRKFREAKAVLVDDTQPTIEETLNVSVNEEVSNEITTEENVEQDEVLEANWNN